MWVSLFILQFHYFQLNAPKLQPSTGLWMHSLSRALEREERRMPASRWVGKERLNFGDNIYCSRLLGTRVGRDKCLVETSVWERNFKTEFGHFQVDTVRQVLSWISPTLRHPNLKMSSKRLEFFGKELFFQPWPEQFSEFTAFPGRGCQNSLRSDSARREKAFVILCKCSCDFCERFRSVFIEKT